MKKSILALSFTCLFSTAIHAQVQTNDETNKRIGINNPTPGFTFHLKHNNGGPQVDGTNGLAITTTGTTSPYTWVLYVGSDGSLQFLQEGALEVKFTANATMDVVSDETRKKDIDSIPEGQLANILRLQARQYRFKDQKDDTLNYGFIAQEAGKVFPSLVSVEREPNGKDSYMMNYIGLTPFLVKAIQEQQAIITEKEAEIAKLNERQNEMEQRLQKMEANLASLPTNVSQPVVAKR